MTIMGRVYLKDFGTILTRPACLARKQKVSQDLNWKLGRRLRHESSKDPSSPSHSKPQPENSIKDRLLSIPGPSWVLNYAQPLAYPLRAYGRAILSSLVIYFLGDLSSQYIQKSSPPSATHDDRSGSLSTAEANATPTEFQYDPERSLRAFVIGGVFSIPSYHWFLFLSRNFNVAQKPVLSLVIKIVVNQIIFTPLFNTYFFGMQSLLSNHGSPATSRLPSDQTPLSAFTILEGFGVRLRAAWGRVKETVPISWYNSCKFWPLVTAFSFTFIKPQSRSVFAGIVAIGWQSYLGILNQRAAEKVKLLRDSRSNADNSYNGS